MKVAVVGVTGLVGRKIMELLEERNFPVNEIYPVASKKSIGKEVLFKGRIHKIMNIQDAVAMKPTIAIFSAGGETSLRWAPLFAEAGTTVIDNSSAWRMDPHTKLIIPEVNGTELTHKDKIIANPNCSTIQMLVALAPLHNRYNIKRLVISTYQSITGTGIKAVKQLENERMGNRGERVYPYEIDKNCLPHCDLFTDNGYTKEEMKLVNETRKILRDEKIRITATAVRVPVIGGHSESVNVEFSHDFDLDEVHNILESSPGIIVLDDIANNKYPMPLHTHEKDEVYVGRIRRDFSNPKTLNMWIVADNLRKGAATNAIQIAELLIKEKLL